MKNYRLFDITILTLHYYRVIYAAQHLCPTSVILQAIIIVSSFQSFGHR